MSRSSIGSASRVRPFVLLASGLAALASIELGISRSQAANQTWVAAPTDANWTTAANWAGAAVPGANNARTTDVATFNTPIPLSGIGGAANPILVDNLREINSITFDTGAGAYVFGPVGGTNQLSLTATSGNRNITMTAGVTEAQVFNTPIHWRYASSTNGAYSFVNNSPNSAATMTFVAPLTNESANTRPLALTLDGTNTGNNTIAQILDNAGANGAIQIIKNGTGTWVLAGANELPQKTSAGNVAFVNVNAGMLVAQNAASLGSITQPNLKVQGTGTLRLDNIALQNAGITMDVTGSLLAIGTSSVNAVNILATATTINFSTSNATDVFTIGAGAAQLTGTTASNSTIRVSGPGQVILNNASTYAGKWSLDGGTVTLNNATALGPVATSAVTFGASSTAKLQLNSNSISLLQLATNATPGSVVVENNGASPAVLTLNNSANNTFSGVLRDGSGGGNLGLVKTNVGTLTIEGANTYTGNTTVSGGTLLANNISGSATGAGAVNVNSTATVGGTGTIAGAVSLASGAAIAPGSGGIGAMSVGALTLSAGSQLNFDITDTATMDRITVTNSGGLTINGGQLNINGGLNAFTALGVYNLIGYSGTLNGSASALTVNTNNKFISRNYATGANGSFVTLTVTDSGIPASFWNANANGNWSSGPWTTAAPNATQAFAGFGGGGTEITAPRTITVDGSYTIGTLSLNNASFAYTIAPGTGGNLTLNNGASGAFITDGAGSHTVSVPLTLTANGATATVVRSQDTLTISGAVGGSGALTKSGPGTLALTGNSTYTGGTNLNSGVLQINSATSLGDLSGGLVFAGGSLQLLADVVSSRNYNLTGASDVVIDTNAHNLTLNGTVTPINNGTGNLIKNGAGTLALNGVNTYIGNTTINVGTLSINSNSSLGDAATGATVTIQNGSTLAASATTSLDNGGANARNVVIGTGGGKIAVDPTMILTIPGRVTGSTLTVTNTGNLVLSNGSDATPNTIPLVVTGGSTLTAGGLATGNGGFGTGAITLQGNATLGSNMTGGADRLIFGNALTVPAGEVGNLNFPSLPAWGQTNTGLPATGAVSGAGTLNVTLTTGIDLQNNFTAFTGNLNFTGNGPVRAVINGGLFNSNGLATTTVDLGGTVSLTAQSNSTGNTITIGALTGSSDTAILGGGSAGSPTWVISGLAADTAATVRTFRGLMQGNAILNKQGLHTLILTGDSTNTGGITLTAGAIQVGDPTINSGGTGSLGNGPISNATAITIARTSGTMTVPGVISGAGTITQTGAVTTIFSNNNTYTGATAINAGTLLLNNTTGSGTGTSVVTLSGSAAIGGTGSTSSAITLGGGTGLTPGSNGVGTFTFNGPLTLGPGAILNYEFAGFAQPNDLAVVSTANGLTINGGGVNLFQSGSTSPFSLNGVYNLIGYNGTIQGTGTSALSVLNPDPNKSYLFGTAGGYVTLQVTPAGTSSKFWNVNADGNWTTGSNWTTGTAPNGDGQAASFGGGGTPITAPRTVTLNASQTVGVLSFNSANSFTLTGSPANTLTLSAPGDAATINDTLGNHTVGVSLALTGDTLVNVLQASDTLTISGAISGFAPNFAKVGLGTVVLSGNNTYSATTGIYAGTLRLTGSGKLGSTGNVLNMNGGTLDLTTTNQSLGTINIAGGDIVNGALTTSSMTFTGSGASTISSVITGGASLQVNGTATGKLVLSGANTFNSGLYLNSGTVSVSADANLGDLSNFIALNGGTLQITGTSYHAFNPARSIGYGGTLGLDIADPTNTFTLTAGSAPSGSALAKFGTGTLVVSGSTAFSSFSTSNVQAGTLQVSGGTTTFATTTQQGLAIAPGNADTATVTIDAGAQIDTFRTIVGGNQANNAGGTATLNVNGNLNSYEWFTVGSAGAGTSTANLNGASVVNVNINGVTATQMEVGDFGASSGILNINGTSQLNLHNNANFVLGVQNNGSGNGAVNQNGGKVTFFSDAGFTPGSSLATPSGLRLGGGTGRTGTYTYNLNGGELIVPVITGTSGTRVFNFNGGKLTPTADNTNLISGVTAAVQAGGAIINTAGTQVPSVPVSVTISNAITHDATAGAPAIDGGLTVNGSGTLTLSGTNTYTGNTTVASGTTLIANSALALQNSKLATFSAGSGLQFSSTVANHAFTIGGFANNNNFDFLDNGGNQINLSVGGQSVTSTYGGQLNGTAASSFTKVGTSTLTLTANSTYPGPTNVNGGLLAINGTHSAGGAYTVNTGGQLGGTGTIAPAIIVGTGGFINPGVGIGTLNTTGAVTINAGGALRTELSGSTNDVLNSLGTLSLNATSVANFSLLTNITKTQFVFGNYTGTLGGGGQFGSITFTTAAGVPTPTGASISTAGNHLTLTVSPQSLRGNFNLDGTITAADIPAMLQALTNLPSYQTAHGLTAAEMLALGDFDGSGAITNADIQPMLAYIGGLGLGSGSLDAVPEPSTLILFGIGCLVVCRIGVRRYRDQV